MSLDIQIYSEPAIEPVTKAEMETALGISSGTIATDSTPYTSIAAGSHPVVTGYTLLGTAVEVLGHTAIVYLRPTNNGTGGTVDAKIQECDTTGGTWTDWATGAFNQVTEASDTAIQEILYTGSKKYIRVAAKTLVAACEFEADVMVWEPNVSEDDMILADISTARVSVENDTSRKLITQTLDYFPSKWPDGDRFKLYGGNLQSVTYVKWKDADGTETTLTENTDYYVGTKGDQCGCIFLLSGGSWPTGELYPHRPISIRYICGYGATAGTIPVQFKRAIKAKCVNLYKNRGDNVIGQTVVNDDTYARLVNLCNPLRDMDFVE